MNLQDFYKKVKVGDIIKMKVLINKETFGEYIYGVVEESDKFLSGLIIDKQFSYIDIDNLTDEDPEIVGNIKEYPDFYKKGYIL